MSHLFATPLSIRYQCLLDYNCRDTQRKAKKEKRKSPLLSCQSGFHSPVVSWLFSKSSGHAFHGFLRGGPSGRIILVGMCPPKRDLSLTCYSYCPCGSVPPPGGRLACQQGHLRAGPATAVQKEVPDTNGGVLLVSATHVVGFFLQVLSHDSPLWSSPLGLPKTTPSLLPSPKLTPFP